MNNPMSCGSFNTTKIFIAPFSPLSVNQTTNQLKKSWEGICIVYTISYIPNNHLVIILIHWVKLLGCIIKLSVVVRD